MWRDKESSWPGASGHETGLFVSEDGIGLAIMDKCSRCGWRCSRPWPDYCPVCGIQLVVSCDIPTGATHSRVSTPIDQPPSSSRQSYCSAKITYQYGLGHGLTRGVTIIGAISIIMYIMTQMNPKFLYPIFGFVPSYAIGKLMLWQFVTANFMHGDLTHLIFNMFGLYTFGGAVEKVLEEKEFIKYFLVCGTGAYVFTFTLWIVGIIPNNLCLGASAGIYGLLLAFSLFYPNQKILLFFAIPMQAKWLALFFGGLEFLLSFYHSGTSHLGHLGGLLTGLLYCMMKKKDLKENFTVT